MSTPLQCLLHCTGPVLGCPLVADVTPRVTPDTRGLGSPPSSPTPPPPPTPALDAFSLLLSLRSETPRRPSVRPDDASRTGVLTPADHHRPDRPLHQPLYHENPPTGGDSGVFETGLRVPPLPLEGELPLCRLREECRRRVRWVPLVPPVHSNSPDSKSLPGIIITTTVFTLRHPVSQSHLVGTPPPRSLPRP